MNRERTNATAPDLSPPPRTGPLLARTLGPSLLLAGLACVALVRDYRSARLEATTRAREIAEACLPRAAAHLQALTRKSTFTPANPANGGESRTAVRWLLDANHDLLDPPPLIWPPKVDPAAGSATSPALPLWEQALEHGKSTNPSGLTTAFQHAFEAAKPTDTTAAGLAIVQLAALRILELAGSNAADLPEAWRRYPDRILERIAAAPSPYTTDILTRFRPLWPELLRLRTNAPVLTPEDLEAIPARVSQARELHARTRQQQAGTQPWPAAFWTDASPEAWLAIERPVADRAPDTTPPAARSFLLVPRSSVTEPLRSFLTETDRRGEFRVRWRVADRDFLMRAGAPEPVAAAAVTEDLSPSEWVTLQRAVAGEPPVVIGVGLADPVAFYAQQRRRVGIFGSLVLAAVALAVVSFVSTRRALLRQHELNRQKSDFVSSVSHELRAPLGSIRLLAEGLERGTVRDDARRQEYYHLISQETQRLGALVENVLDFSRIEQGRKRYELEPTDLHGLLRQTLAAFAPLAHERKVRLEAPTIDSAESIEIQADGRAVQQALLNLLDNALKHSPAESAIRVEVTLSPARATNPHDPAEPKSSAPREVRLRVCDSGPGIPAEEHERIFEPFYRRGSELRREQQGVGIGLSIVRHIVLAHGGRVEVASEPGHGAAFTLVLPCVS